ncbi:hypothetical protein AAHE18_02G175100 [Arachis hypogaea]
MIILSWNCRGVAASLTISELLNLCKQKKPSIIFLIETRAKDIKIKRIRRRLHFDKYFCVEPRDLSGGLCILWKDIVNINVYSWCDNYIKTKISDSKGNGWSCNFLYGNPIFRNRKRLWKMLTESNINPEEPQACLGDFNDILTQEEKIGLHPKPKNQVEEFENFVNTNCLMDLDLKGNKFTWFSNSRGDFITRKRLDRVLVNWRWREIFQHATLEALPAISSDHCPLVLNLNPVKKVNKYFRYEVFWDDHEECKEVIQKGWNMISAQRYNWNSFSQKIKHCKEDLKRWSRKTFARADLEIAKLKERLIGLQNSEFTEDQQYSIAQIRDKISKLWMQEEKYWGARSRLKWFKWGDKNTFFFHATTIQRRDRNRIDRIKNEEGQWIQGETEILSLAENYFLRLFKASDKVNMKECIKKILKRVTDEMNKCLMEHKI